MRVPKWCAKEKKNYNEIRHASKNSNSSTTPSLKAILALATDCFIASYVRPPSIRSI
jgi:hypothetical protein